MNTETTFDARPVVASALATSLFGAVVMVVIGMVAGLELWLTAVMAVQVAVSFAVMGGWAAASFGQDDSDDVAGQLVQPTLVYSVEPVESSQPTHRTAA